MMGECIAKDHYSVIVFVRRACTSNIFFASLKILGEDITHVAYKKTMFEKNRVSTKVLEIIRQMIGLKKQPLHRSLRFTQSDWSNHRRSK